MVAIVRCEEISSEKYNYLAADKGWLALEKAVRSGSVSVFGKSISLILTKYLSDYDLESIYFEEDVRVAKRQYLESKALQLVHPAYVKMLGHLRSNAFEGFRTQLEVFLGRGEGFAASTRKSQQYSMIEFDQGCAGAAIEQANWDILKVRAKLQHDIETHASHVRKEKLSEVLAAYEKRLSMALSETMETLFETDGTAIWASLRSLLQRESHPILSAFSSAVANFELDEEAVDKMVHTLKDCARKLVERKASNEAAKVLICMKDRFITRLQP